MQIQTFTVNENLSSTVKPVNNFMLAQETW